MVFLFRGFLFKVLPTIRFSACEVFLRSFSLYFAFFKGFCSRKEKRFIQRDFVLFYVIGVLSKSFFSKRLFFFFFRRSWCFCFFCVFQIFFLSFFRRFLFFKGFVFFSFAFFQGFFKKWFSFFWRVFCVGFFFKELCKEVCLFFSKFLFRFFF